MNPRLFSSLGEIWLYVAKHPHCTLPEVAGGLWLTQRSVYKHLAELRKAGVVVVAEKVGRTQHFTVDGTVEVEVFGEKQRLKDLFTELGR